MNRRVTFKTLWLVSERDVTARKQTFNEQKTLLFGPNTTGKSRIIKNLFWVFGCSPVKWLQGAWDPDSIAGLDFQYMDQDYFVLRDGKRIGLFRNDRLMFATENATAWAGFIGPFFGYHLELSRPQSSKYAQAGMEYLTLPFYMDQEGSWGTNWDTYVTLSQFSQWKKPVFEAFIGLYPNSYFEARRKLDEVKAKIKGKRNDKEAQRLAFKSVRDVLPKNLPSLDLTSFRSELAVMGQKALKTQREQVKLRGQLLAIVNLREKLQAEVQLARAAQQELVADMTYLAEWPGQSIECPTCGTVHEKSFHARFELSQDAESISELVAELNRKFDATKDEEAKVRGDLRRIEKKLSEIDDIAHERKARLRLEEVLAAQSKKTLDAAFRKVSDSVDNEIHLLEKAEELHSALTKKFTDKRRQTEVKDYFSGQVVSLSNILNVPPEEQLRATKAGDRAQAGGSGSPRSMLAIHLAMLRTNVVYGDTPLFPFVVDTPQQSGQDFQNLGKMIEVLGASAGQDHQVLLAVETLPDGVDCSEFEVVQFTQKQAALSRDAYAEVVARLRVPLATMKETLRLKIEQLDAI